MPLYHVWFATKRRKWLLQGEVMDAACKLMSEVARDKSINLLERQAIADHMHLLLEVENKEALSKAMNLLKGVSARRLFQQVPELKFDAGVSNFWQHRYGAKAIPASSAESVRTYIKTQWDRLEKYERVASFDAPAFQAGVWAKSLKAEACSRI